MKPILSILFTLALCGAFGQVPMYKRIPFFQHRVAPTGGGPTYLITENFEDATSGYDNNNANNWSATGSGVDPKYTTSPAPLAGSQSCKFTGGDKTYVAFTGQSEIWCSFLFEVPTLSTGSDPFAYFMDSSANVLCYMLYDGDFSGRVSGFNGSQSTRTTAGISGATKYECWMHYKKGTGSDSIIEVEFQPAGTPRSGNGDNYTSKPDGTATADAARFYFVDGVNVLKIADSLKISTTGYPP